MYTPARPLHSSADPNILNVATTRTKPCGQRTFTYQGPSNWNTVCGEVRRIGDMFAEAEDIPLPSVELRYLNFLLSFYIIVNL